MKYWRENKTFADVYTVFVNLVSKKKAWKQLLLEEVHVSLKIVDGQGNQGIMRIGGRRDTGRWKENKQVARSPPLPQQGPGTKICWYCKLLTGCTTCGCGRRSGLMVGVLDSGLNSPGSSCGRSTALCPKLDKAILITLAVPLFTKVNKWVPANLLLGITLWWTSIPSRGE